MFIVPSTAVETMGLGALGGLTAFGQGRTGPRAIGSTWAIATPA
jgi:hypothetical protein